MVLKYISEINKNNDEKIIVVMDSDGQDDPSILDKIIKIYENSPNKVITINRSQRSEPLWFKILYEIHYHVLIIFSGRKIRYGNYSLISLDKLKKNYQMVVCGPHTQLRFLNHINLLINFFIKEIQDTRAMLK